jgi:hypothetical protein
MGLYHVNKLYTVAPRSLFSRLIYDVASAEELMYFNNVKPVTVAERSKACTVFVRSEAGTLGSNPSEGMDV